MSEITTHDSPMTSSESSGEALFRAPSRLGAQSSVPLRSPSKGRLWTGRILSTLAVLFLLFDAAGKLVMPPPVVLASARLGFPISLSVGVGILLLVCTALYAIPSTAVLGAVLLTAFFGGAVAIQMRTGSPVFETVFPVIFGVIVWAGIIFRENRILQVFPLRRPCPRR
jgi:DoxX-like family